MKSGSKVEITMGAYKGKRGTVRPKRGTNAKKDELVVNIIEGPVIIINKSFVK